MKNDKRKRSGFDSVPADDGFRNYMARKIELQRQQFGLVVPPPPPPDSCLLQSRSFKRATPSKGSDDERQGNGSARQHSTPVGSDGNAPRSGHKTVRFHPDSEAGGLSQVLANLKQRHARSAIGSLSTRKRRRQSRHSIDTATAGKDPSSSHGSILGVLDNLQKRHGTMPKKRHRNQRDGVDPPPIPKSLELAEGDGSVASSCRSLSHGSVRGEDAARSKWARKIPSQEDGVRAQEFVPAVLEEANKALPPCDGPRTNQQQTSHRTDLFFAGVVVLVNGHTTPDATTLMRLLHKHGGDLEKYESRRITHVIAEQLSAAKANVYKRQKNPTPVCRPTWITDSVERGKLLPFGDYLLGDVKDGAGTKSVKSFFKPPPDSDRECSTANKNKNPLPRESCDENEEKSAPNSPNLHRWQDAPPSEAKYHLNEQVRTVGNDPHFLDSYFSNSRLSYIGSFKQRAKPTKSAASRSLLPAGAEKFVLLCDMDCFFAAVALKKYPQYRNRPVAVGHACSANSNAGDRASTTKKYSKNSSSELSTCNYVARKHGIKKGMFLGDAIQKCPDLVVLPYDFQGFEEVSSIVADQLHGFAEQYHGVVEQVSCDELYVEININPDDCPGKDVFGFLNTLAEHIRADIVKKTDCTASIGIGANKLLAKLAAERVKPNACCVVKNWREFLCDLDLRDIPGIGRKFQKKLQPHNLCSVQDIWALEDDAERVLGEIIGVGTARKIVRYCHGDDNRAVTPAVRKSIGAECNYGVRFEGPYGADHMIRGLAKEVQKRMTGVGVRGAKLVLKILRSKDPSKVPGKFLGHGLCDSFSRSADIPLTRDEDVISSTATKVYHKLGIDKSLVRGMGIVISSLTADEEDTPAISSPSKLCAWLEQDNTTPTTLPTNGRNQEEVLKEELETSNRVVFEIEEETMPESGSPMMPSFSQLDQDVLRMLPEDILSEVKTMYPKKQHIQNNDQSSLKRSPKPSPKSLKKHVGRGGKRVKPITIAGQTSVRRMLKLACIKAGDDQLHENNVSLTQLDCLPLEVQLQIANDDNIKIAKQPKTKMDNVNRSRSFSATQDDNPEVEVMQSQVSQIQIQEQGGVSEDNSSTNFYQENVVPLREFISSQPTPDDETIETVNNFLLLWINERRVDDTITFLRTIKNMEKGWDNTVYLQLRESAIRKIQSTTGNMLDIKWLQL